MALTIADRSSADELVYSIRAWNFQDRYIRHKNFMTYLDQIGLNDEQAAKDATFYLRDPLRRPVTDTNCYTLGAQYLKGYYLRHRQFRLVLAKFDQNDSNFGGDATFCLRKGLAGKGYSFESLNYPGYFIRHANFELWVNKNDGSTGFKRDATFDLVHPVHAPMTIDPGTNQVPSTD